MNNDERKSKFEKEGAEIFFSHINKLYGFDYQSESLPNDVQATDVKGISKNGNHAEIKVELSEARKCEGYPNFDINQIQSCINSKIEKYRKNDIDVGEVIFLIQGYLGREWMNDSISSLKEKNISAPFRGIYYIYPGDTRNSSFVMEIKNAFN